MALLKIIIVTLQLVFFFGQCVGEYIPPGPRYNCPKNIQQIYPCECMNGTDKGLYVRCENANLGSLSIALNNLASFGSPIENLTFYQCSFERLYGTMFFKAKVRIMHIENTPLKTIDEHTFYGINNTLQELHIKNSNMSEFPAKAFKVLGNLTVLNIDYHNIQQLEKDILAESLLPNHLEKLHITNGLLTEFAIESFQALRKLKTIDLHANLLLNLKRNQFKNLREVEVLDLSHNNITKLESHHIADLTKLNWCNISHNHLTEITRGTFARNSVVRVLNAAANKIKKLDANTFRGMRFLRRLYLNDNKISDIGRGTFSSITRIGTIDLARNFINKIDYQMFAKLNYIEIINIAENNISEIQKQSFHDLYLTNINISHNSVEKIENFAFENCPNITKLDLSFNKLTELTKDTFDATTYADVLMLAYNNFTDMSQIPLHTMTGMRILNISHNGIETIAKSTFPKLYELHTIDISHNNLSTIANAVFQPLFSLRYVDMSYNSLADVKSATFGTLPTLLHLDMSFNILKTIARGGMAKLTSLRYFNLRNNLLEKLFEIPISLNHLDISNNWIQEIPDNIWPRMNSLLSIDLSGNRLSNNLKSNSFGGLLTLQTLKLNANGITRAPHESLNGLSTLQYLHLENNNITELDKSAFGRLPVVFELNLYNNNIINIKDRAFDGLLQLLKLNLSKNAIQSLSNDVFFGLVSLRTLDLSSNFLEKLDNKTNGVLDRCLSLQTINLSHNKFTIVNRKTFPSDPYTPYKLEEVDLSYNEIPILTYDITFGTKLMKKLNVSHNFIANIRKGVLGNLTSLEILDISHNKLEDLMSTESYLQLPLNITEVYLQNNEIFNIPYNELGKRKLIRKLDLSGNKLEEFPNELVDILKVGGAVFYEDNPLDCNCKLRPLQHFIQTLTTIPTELSALQCATPSRLTGNYVTKVSDDQLQCLEQSLGTEESLGTENNRTFEILPDIKFRRIFMSKGFLTATWFVTPTRDIADSYLNLRNENNTIFYDIHQSYDTRYAKIPAEIIIEAFSKSNTVQMCVFAKNSLGLIRQWFESQCVKLPDDLKSTIKRYNPKNNDVYMILSDKPTALTAKTSGVSATKTLGSTKLICFLLIGAFLRSLTNY